MIRIEDPHDGERIANAAGFVFNPGADRVIARVSPEGKLFGGCVYREFTRASISVHIAGFTKHWASRDLLWVGFHYPFIQLGVQKLFATIPDYNTDSLEIAKKMGFKYETRISEVFVDGDMLIYSMKRDDCRYLELNAQNLVSNREGR
jgi:RimJ/RimL family protein N-acetyltransferase